MCTILQDGRLHRELRFHWMLLLEDREVRRVRSSQCTFSNITYSDTVNNVLHLIILITLQGGRNPSCYSVLQFRVEYCGLSWVTRPHQ